MEDPYNGSFPAFPGVGNLLAENSRPPLHLVGFALSSGDSLVPFLQWHALRCFLKNGDLFLNGLKRDALLKNSTSDVLRAELGAALHLSAYPHKWLRMINNTWVGLKLVVPFQWFPLNQPHFGLLLTTCIARKRQAHYGDPP